MLHAWWTSWSYSLLHILGWALQRFAIFLYSRICWWDVQNSTISSFLSCFFPLAFLLAFVILLLLFLSCIDVIFIEIPVFLSFFKFQLFSSSLSLSLCYSSLPFPRFAFLSVFPPIILARVKFLLFQTASLAVKNVHLPSSPNGGSKSLSDIARNGKTGIDNFTKFQMLTRAKRGRFSRKISAFLHF